MPIFNCNKISILLPSIEKPSFLLYNRLGYINILKEVHMIHKILNTIGLGILGIDPMTAIIVLSMGLKKDQKIKISAFVISFALFSILFGTIVSYIFGATAIDYLKSIIPKDDSIIWSIIELIILIIILPWLFKRIYGQKSKKEEEKDISGSIFSYILAGIIFAITSFTDPTYYATIILGSETNNLFLIILLITIWFLISQFMTIIVYIANELNFLNKIVNFVDKFKTKYQKTFNNIFNVILILIAIILIIDLGYCLIIGKYLF